jgi:hypothetical protein
MTINATDFIDALQQTVQECDGKPVDWALWNAGLPVPQFGQSANHAYASIALLIMALQKIEKNQIKEIDT